MGVMLVEALHDLRHVVKPGPERRPAKGARAVVMGATPTWSCHMPGCEAMT